MKNKDQIFKMSWRSARGQNDQRGVSIFLALMMLTLLLSLALGVNALLVSQIKTQRNSGQSVIAFYASETGIESALKNVPRDSWEDFCVSNPNICHGYLDLNNNAVEDGDDATYDFTTMGPGGTCASDAVFCVESIGTYQKTRRVVQISFTE